jgi:hypothetical protein
MIRVTAAAVLRLVAALIFAAALAACGGETSEDSGSTTAAATTSTTSTTTTTPAAPTTSSDTTTADPVSFSASSYSVAQGAGSVTVTVTRSGSASSSVSIDYATSDGTAVAGTDYTAASGTLTWAENDSTAKTVSIPISNATPFSGDKSFAITLTNPSTAAYIASPGSATITISGDETATAGSLELAAATYAIPQTSPTITVTVNRTGGSNGAVAVNYSTANGTAVAGTNYTATSGALSWASGDAGSKTITIPLSTTTAFSGSKTFTITLSDAASGATLGAPSSATVTITGTTTASSGTVSLFASSLQVSQGAGTLSVIANRIGGSNGAISVNYATANGTAVAGTNYTATSGTLSWASGDATAKTFTVAISNATPFSGNKTFSVALSNPSALTAIGNPGTATVTIAGDAAAAIGSVQLSAPTYAVGQSAGSVTVTATRTGGSTGAISVGYATTSGTAVAGTAFTAASGTLNWASGDTSSKTFTVAISDATPFSGTESFSVGLSGATGGATLASPSSATVTITGNASAAVGSLQLSGSSYTVLQSAGSLTVTVNRTGGSSGAVSLSYDTTSGTAVAGTDFTAASGTLNWASGDSTAKTFSVPVSNAAPFSGTKQFSVGLSGATGGATLSTPTSATVTITGSSSGTPVSTPSGSLPTAATITNVYAEPEGATLYFTTQAPANGNYIQYYTATSNPGGITAKSNGNSNRIDIYGLTAGTNYTFTVTATNAVGTGPASAASASVTAGPYADYWVANGSGLNPNWSFYPGSAGNSVTWNAVVNGIAPLTGTSVIQFASTTSNEFTLPFIEHSLIDSNGDPNGVNVGGGRLYLGPYTYLVVSVWPTRAGQSVGFQFYQTNALNGELTQENGANTQTFEDISQNWTPNSLSSAGFSFLDLATGNGNPVGSNTSDTITTQSSLSNAAHAGDYYELSQPDLSVGNYVYIGNGQNASWGPTSMTVGQWNTYKIPLSAFGNTSFPYGNQILKFALQDTSMLGTNTFYVTALGFTNH